MSGKDTPKGTEGTEGTEGSEDLEGLGLSSEQYDEDQVLEVDNRSVDYDELREHAKNPKATWSQDAPTDGEDEPPA